MVVVRVMVSFTRGLDVTVVAIVPFVLALSLPP